MVGMASCNVMGATRVTTRQKAVGEGRWEGRREGRGMLPSQIYFGLINKSFPPAPSSGMKRANDSFWSGRPHDVIHNAEVVQVKGVKCVPAQQIRVRRIRIRRIRIRRIRRDDV